jgi:toxin ParE1/3/4
MIWDVNYTDDAISDLQGVYDYISDVLLEPVTADKQTNRIMDAADSLDNMPFRYRLYDKEPWHSRVLRVLPVDNYLIFYLPEESKYMVTIIRIMYARSDIDRHLNNNGNNSDT